MIFEVETTQKASLDLEKHRKAGNKQLLRKIRAMIEELKEHPTTGTGRPEQLKHYQRSVWSRRIDHKHRMVYEIQGDKVIILVLSLWGHYGDK